MAEEEVPEHGGGREQIADQDLPPHEHVLHGLAEDADDAQKERLEAREEDDDGDDERRLALGRSDDRGGDDPEGDEREAVDHGIAEDGHQREATADRFLHAIKERSAEEHRRFQRVTAEAVDEEEPYGYDERTDDAGHDALAQHGALGIRHGTSRRHLSARRFAPATDQASRARRTP